MAWAIGESRALQPGQPLPGVGDFGQAGVGVLTEDQESLTLLPRAFEQRWLQQQKYFPPPPELSDVNGNNHCFGRGGGPSGTNGL